MIVQINSMHMKYIVSFLFVLIAGFALAQEVDELSSEFDDDFDSEDDFDFEIDSGQLDKLSSML